MEEALVLKQTYGIESAARWLERQGISYELAILVLVGFARASRYIELGGYGRKSSNKLGAETRAQAAAIYVGTNASRS